MKLIKDNKVYQNIFDEMKRDRKWFFDNYQELVNEYPEEFVAIWNEKVIANDTDLKDLLKKIPSHLKNKDPFRLSIN